MIKAEKVYRDIVEMSLKEREKLFTIIARRGFEKDLYKHYDVADEISESPFTVKEAAEYLEVSDNTLRRWIKGGKIHCKSIGRNKVIYPHDLKAFKQNHQKKT